MFEDRLDELDPLRFNQSIVVSSDEEDKDSSTDKEEDLDNQKFCNSFQEKNEPIRSKEPRISLIEPSSSANAEEENVCTICMEPWTSTGAHRLTSLRCGHLYGKSCIERWISKSACCPQCKTVSKRSHIRLIFARRLTALDVGERDRLLTQLAQERNQREIAELREAKANMEIQLLSTRVIQLQALVERAKELGASMLNNEQKATNPASMMSWRLCRKIDNALRLKGTGNSFLLPRMTLVDGYSGALLILAHHPIIFDSSLVVKISLLDTKSPVCHIPLTLGRAMCMVVSPWHEDEGQYAIGCVDGSVLLMTLHSDRLVKRLIPPTFSNIQSNSALFSIVYDRRDKTALFVGNAEGQIWHCTNQNDWKLLYTCPSRQAIHSLIQFSITGTCLIAVTATELISLSLREASNSSFSLVPLHPIQEIPRWCYRATELGKDSLLLASIDERGKSCFHMIKGLEGNWQGGSNSRPFTLLSNASGIKTQPTIIWQQQKPGETVMHTLVHAHPDGSIAFVDCNLPRQEVMRIPILTPPTLEEKERDRLVVIVATAYDQMTDTLIVVTSKDVLFFYR